MFTGNCLWIFREGNSKKAEHLEKVGIARKRSKLLRSYSKACCSRWSAQAIIHDLVLILDKPMSGLDPDGRYQIGELIRELGQKGTTIFQQPFAR